MEEQVNNFENQAIISGYVTAVGATGISRSGEIFVPITVLCKRISQNCDVVSVVVPRKLLNGEEWKKDGKLSLIDEYVSIVGEVRSTYNPRAPRHAKLRMYVYASSIVKQEDDSIIDLNDITVNVRLVDKCLTRFTPRGLHIADVHMVRADQKHTQPQLIGISWGNVAKTMSKLPVGTLLKICARMQSREFNTVNEDETVSKHIAHELSIMRFEILDKQDEVSQ